MRSRRGDSRTAPTTNRPFPRAEAPFRKRELSPQVTEGFPIQRERKKPSTAQARSPSLLRKGGFFAADQWSALRRAGGAYPQGT